MNRFYLFLLSFLLPINLSAQQSWELEVIPLDKDLKFLDKEKIKSNVKSKTKDAVLQLLETQLDQLRDQAYLSASIDSIFFDSTKVRAYLFIGEQYQWLELDYSAINKTDLQSVRFHAKKYQTGQQFHYKRLRAFQKDLLKKMEEQGHPFAHCYLDNFTIINQQISARIHLIKGPLIRFGEIQLEKIQKNKKLRLNKKYLSSYLGIKKGDIYDERLLKKLPKLLNELPFIQQNQAPLVDFSKETAALRLFLSNRSASKVDIIFGFLPQKNPQTQEQQFNFTGNIHLDLLNPFGGGKRLQFKWQQLQENSSDLFVNVDWPYIFSAPIGVNSTFKLFKRDSSFLNLIFDIGAQYQFSASNYLKLHWQFRQSNLIEVPTQLIQQSRQLPEQLDWNINAFGLSYYLDRLDYKYNPRKGSETQLSAHFGLKTIRRNITIENLEDPLGSDFSFLYDSLDLNTYNYRFHLKHKHFFPLWSWSSLLVQGESGLLYSPNALYKNELFRLGGHALLRGFNEESILASWYNVLTIEWRFIFGRNSYAYAFTDLAYLQNRTQERIQEDYPYSFGLGMALETKVGIFALSYALGAEQGNPILLNNGKVHLGYVYAF